MLAFESASRKLARSWHWACRTRMLLILTGLVLGCRPTIPEKKTETPVGTPWFADITEESGLNFIHDAGVSGNYFMPESLGSGGALFDFNNDGLLDIYLVQNGGPHSKSTNHLFRQGPPGRFTDVSAGSGLDIAGHNMGVAIGDVNNDGWPDVLVTQYGGIKLFLNNGNGTFTDVTEAAGLDNPAWGTSACFFDYDRDGWLDLIVVNYVDYDPSVECRSTTTKRIHYCGPRNFSGKPSKLFHNKGLTKNGKPGAVQFEDVSKKSGLGGQPGRGLGVVCADFNGDGWPDIFIANDEEANRLWINQKDGTFQDEALLRGVAFDGMGQAQGNMGIALGDVDGDGLLDLFVTHLTDEIHTLWRQGPVGMFHDQTGPAGLASPRWRGTGFGTVFGDFNHDGALDLAIVNGRIEVGADGGNPALGTHWGPYAERNQLFSGDGTGRFRDISLDNPGYCATARVSRGLACGDIDGDGTLDLLVTTAGGPALLYRNIAPNRGHWLMVRAVDPALKRDAHGAKVVVRAKDKSWVGLVNPGQSYLCSCDPRVHFGLGEVTRVDSLTVFWPDGVEENFPGQEVDHLITIRKGEGQRKSK